MVQEELVAKKSDEALAVILTEKREILDTQECKLEDMNRLKKKLDVRKSKLALKLSKCEETKDKLDRELIHKQQTVLHLNVEQNKVAQALNERITEVQGLVEKHDKAIPRYHAQIA